MNNLIIILLFCSVDLTDTLTLLLTTVFFYDLLEKTVLSFYTAKCPAIGLVSKFTSVL